MKSLGSLAELINITDNNPSPHIAQGLQSLHHAHNPMKRIGGILTCPFYRQRPWFSESFNTCLFRGILCEQQIEGEKIMCTFSFLNELFLVPGKTHLAYGNCQDSANFPVQSNFLPRMRGMLLFRKDTISIQLKCKT